MRLRILWLAGAILASLCVSAWAQPVGPAPFAPPGAPAAVHEQTPAPIESAMLPDQKFEPIQLNQMLLVLKDAIPGFNSVVVRDPRVPEDYPTLPTFSAKNVTVGQFLEFLKMSYPGLNIQRVDGPAAPLYVVRIGDPSPAIAMNGGGLVPDGGAPLGGDGPPQIRIYRLSDIITSLATTKTDNGDHLQQSLDDVLSLIQSSLEQADAKTPATLKVHPATQTLVFKGTPAQTVIIEQVLDALRPTPEDLKQIKQSQIMLRRATDKNEALTQMNEKLSKENQELKAQHEATVRLMTEKLAQENQGLKAQLEAMARSTTQPTK